MVRTMLVSSRTFWMAFVYIWQLLSGANVRCAFFSDYCDDADAGDDCKKRKKQDKNDSNKKKKNQNKKKENNNNNKKGSSKIKDK